MSYESRCKTFYKPHFNGLSKTISAEDEAKKKELVNEWRLQGFRVTEDEDVFGVCIRGVKYTTQENNPLSAA